MKIVLLICGVLSLTACEAVVRGVVGADGAAGTRGQELPPLGDPQRIETGPPYPLEAPE